jgi:hypothetical protein
MATRHSKRLAQRWRQRLVVAFNWLTRSFGGVALGLGVGFMIGVTTRLPLFPYAIPNDNLLRTLQASAGALIGAGMAGILARLLISKGDFQYRRTVARVIREPAILMQNLINQPDDSSNLLPDAVNSALKEIMTSCEQSLERLEMLSSSHTQITEGRGIAIVDAKIAIKKFIEERFAVAKLIIEGAMRDGVPTLIVRGDAQDNETVGGDWPKDIKGEIGNCFDKLNEALILLGHPFRPTASLYQ